MKAQITWVNPNPTGKSVILSIGTKQLENGMRSIGGVSGFVSFPTKEEQTKFKVGDSVELPDTAKVEKVTFKKGTAEERTIEAWTW